MKRSFLDSVLRGAEALAARDPVGTLPDPDLVRRFAAGRDPAAFAVLVRRHGPLVWGVCRNLLPADADAEDAFQATFLALVRSAATIRRTEALGGWLHGVAYRVALKARRAATRRKKREVIAAVPEPSSPVPDAAWDELQAAVHDEVCKLPDKLRLPFVLCTLQGRAQKEAAEVLGWKVGTVSGRLSEARRRLLERLARRGVPVGVAVGAAVLGGVAGRAAVPPSINVKVLSAAGDPAAVSPTVLSLARGVTPMYLTRTKMLAAGLVLVGVLTTGAGVLSRADAQAPPGKYDDALRHYYDALRVGDAPRTKWEYKFIPVEKPLTTTDLQTVLAHADQDGWSYCGSQELAAEKTGKISPHMVFKRPRSGAVGAGDANNKARQDAAAALAEEAAARAAVVERERAALLDQLKRRDAAIAERKAEADAVRRLADEQAAKARDLVEEARRRDAVVEQQRALAEKARKEAERARAEAASQAASDKNRQKQLEAMKAQYEAMIQQLQAELKAKSAAPPTKADPNKKKPEPQASAADPFGSTARTPGPDDAVTALVELKHIDGKLAVAMLGKAMPDAKIVAEVGPNRIVLSGPAKTVIEARDLIRSKIDLPERATKRAGDDKPDTAIFRLTHITASDAVKMLQKVIGSRGGVRYASDDSTNALFVSGPPAVLADIKKLIGEADKVSGPAK